MKNNKIHIVSFDVPFPADYGGAIDVYYKIKALSDAGVEIYLHCYEYGRGVHTELESLCKEVWYYPRKTGISGISAQLPYIVYSRRSNKLLQRLSHINAPIIFEGVHTTYFLNHPLLKDRFKAVRTHNIEHIYYDELSRKETKILKRIYYKIEAVLLKSYENKLSSSNAFLSLSKTDADFFSVRYPKAKTRFIGPFHPFDEVTARPGKGSYCLYHGNLNHPENIEAALFLLQQVAKRVSLSLIIAGKNPAPKIIEACTASSNCQLVANPNAARMDELIANAHIHVLPTFQPTGMKLKLLYALFNGRHVIVNRQMLYGTGLEGVCRAANDADDFVKAINELADISFSQQNINERAALLMKDYNNESNAQNIITDLLY